MSSTSDVCTDLSNTGRRRYGPPRTLVHDLLTLLPGRQGTEAWLREAANVLASHLDAAVVRVWSANAENVLELRTAVGLEVPFEGLQDRVPIGHSELGQVLLSGRPYRVDCLAPSTPPDVTAWARSVGVTSFIALPLVVDGNAWGVLALFSRGPIDGPHEHALQEAAGLLGAGLAMTLARTGGEEALQLLQALSRNVPSALVTLDRRGRVTRWNQAAEQIFGWTFAEIRGKPLPIVIDERRSEFQDEFEHVLSGRSLRRVPTDFCRADQSRVPVVRTAVPLLDSSGDVAGTLEIITDDSPRVHAARCLQVHAQVTKILGSSQGFEEAAPSLLTAVGEWVGAETAELWMLDEERRVLSRSEVWAASVEVRDQLAAAELRVRAESSDWPAPAVRGFQVKAIGGESNARPSVWRSTHLSSLSTRSGWGQPIRKGDKAFGVLTCSGAGLPEPDERTLTTLGFIADAIAQFLDRKETEAALAQTESNWRQSQKMDAIGLLAGGVAHDFNNLLTVILAYSELGLDEIDEDHPLREMFSEIHSAGERAAAMTRQLLAVSRQQPARMGPVNLNKLVADMDRMLQRLVGPQVQLIKQGDDGIPLVQADVNQLEQVLLNLVVNARDAMPGGGKITVSTRNVALTAADVHGRPEMRAGDFVVLSVADTGCGMDAATLSRIFEPFFTTKEVGRGTGMGLSTVFGIVKQHDGFLKVDSTPDVGTTFFVFLPQSRQNLAVNSFDDAPAEAPAGTERVLVVDRDDSVRGLVRRLLELRGYTVLEASHGGEALDLLRKPRHGIALVIADTHLPVLDGVALVHKLRDLRVPPKTLLISANSEPPADLDQDLSRQFLAKPFTSMALAQRVRAVLDGR